MTLAEELQAYTKGVQAARWAYEVDPLELSRILARRDVLSLVKQDRRDLADDIRREMDRWPAPLLLE